MALQSIGPDYVRIFDTTLRDGEQSPGATMTSPEKLEVARALARLGVDVIEAGFPAASPDDLAAVRAIAEEVGRTRRNANREAPSICALARAATPDIDKAWEAVKAADHPRIHTFLATSPIHMKHKLRMEPKDVLERVRVMVAYARGLCEDVQFSPEDSSRSDLDFLLEIVAAAVKAGASTINLPDTVGYATPDEFGALVAAVRAVTPKEVVLAVHCHDDLGLATANTLAGLRAGARQAEVTINGIGERAGNTSLEEVAMILATRAGKIGLKTGIDAPQIMRTSRLVSSCTGFAVQPNKAIVGANAFAHESGIHQDGMLKNAETYEIMTPESVGAAQTTLVLGKHSGRAAFAARLRDLGFPLQGPELEAAFTRFKAVAERRKYVTDADLEALLSSETHQPPQAYVLDGLLVGCGTTLGLSSATVRLRGPDGQVQVQAAVGTGPVDAAYKAIDSIVHAKLVLVEFAVRAVTEGIDALGQVSVRIRSGDTHLTAQHDAPQAKIFHGHGADTDILVASAKAYLAAINRMIASEAPGLRAGAPSHAQGQERASAAAREVEEVR